MMTGNGGSLSIDTCLQPDAVRALLQAALPDAADGRVKIDALRVVSARRSASKRRNPNPLTLCYELDVHDCGTGAARKRQFYGKVYRDGASAAAARDTVALHLPQLDMVLWAWPDDPGLPQLGALLDPAQTQRWWGEAAQEIRALRYVPECRATLCYTRQGAAPAQLFAKTFSNPRGEAIYRRFVHFWDVAHHDARAPMVAQPLGYCADTRTLWQAQATGKPLLHALTSVPASASWLPQRVAYAIAAVHLAPPLLAGETPRDTAYWLTEIRRRRKKIDRVAPAYTDRVARVAEVLQQTAETLPPHPLTLIHGDCHPDQMWLDCERVVLFDFDEFTLGDPMEDMAAFLTKLVPADTGGAFAASLLKAYQQIAPRHFCAQRLQWHLAIQGLLQTSRAFIFQVADWRAEVERRLSCVETLCEPLVSTVPA